MKTKTLIINGIIIALLAATIVIIIYGKDKIRNRKDSYDDGIEQIDANTIYLGGSGVEVHFSDVILSQHNETRKLIVSEQNATVSTELTDRLINKLDFNFMKKTQKVSYTGKGYFVVDLDKLTEDCIEEDTENKVVTIYIDHAYLQAIEIDPNNVIIDDVNQSLLARGDIELSLKDYNEIEKELRNRLGEKFDTAENGQEADQIALEMVKEVYEPVIQAIDKDYKVEVKFKEDPLK